MFYTSPGTGPTRWFAAVRLRPFYRFKHRPCSRDASFVGAVGVCWFIDVLAAGWVSAEGTLRFCVLRSI